MADLYSHRREIELGYREIKQTMQLSKLTLRSKKPELMRDLASMGQLVKLPTRRERAFPRVVKERR